MSGGTLLLVVNNDLNDSDKTITVPAGYVYEVLWGQARLTSTATVGNRQIRLEVEDETATAVYDLHAGVTQAASLTYHYQFAQGVFRETAVIDGAVDVPIPMDFFVLPGHTIRIYDVTAVDAAADDLLITLCVRKLPVGHEDIT